MAWTVTMYPTVFGNKKSVGIRLQPDSVTFNVETGLSFIEFYALGPSSMSSSNIHAYVNSGCGGTALGGILGVTGVTSGDDLYVTVFGH